MGELLGVRGVGREGVRRGPRRRAGHLDQHQQVGHPVLERLEGADRPAELHPLLGVGDGHLERPARTDRPRGRPRRPHRPGRRARAQPARRRSECLRTRRVTQAGSSGPSMATSSGHSTPDRAPRGRRRWQRRGRWPGPRRARAHRGRRTPPPRRPRSAAAAAPWPPRRPPASSASAVTSEDSRGEGASERPTSSSTIIDSSSENPAPSYSSGIAQRGHPDLLAQRLPERLVVPRLRDHRRADRGGVGALGRAASGRSTPAPAAPRRTRTPSGDPQLLQQPGAVARRCAPCADERADLGEPDAQVELRGVADRAVHLQTGPRGEVRRVGGTRPWRRTPTPRRGRRRRPAAGRSRGRCGRRPARA